jgi:hypothetical protein
MYTEKRADVTSEDERKRERIRDGVDATQTIELYINDNSINELSQTHQNRNSRRWIYRKNMHNGEVLVLQ